MLLPEAPIPRGGRNIVLVVVDTIVPADPKDRRRYLFSPYLTVKRVNTLSTLTPGNRWYISA
jgi:hypothetical protein